MGDINLKMTRRQLAFHKATADEVLFGGAAGGGKSYGQLIDAMLYALKYPNSKQIILRRTYRDLELSIIRQALMLYPRNIFKYSSTSHTGRFMNGSVIDFGYCDAENDVMQYYGAEYDMIRFDELTHFTEYQYLLLLSRLRGATPIPRQIKCSTNPGNVGHSWVKARFIDPAPPGEEFKTDAGTTRVFIPSKLDDNVFLNEHDPSYKARLMALPEKERKALLLGEWDLFDGQYFSEWRREVHVCEPFPIPKDWRVYRAFDYGLDMFAVVWAAVSPQREVFVFREFCQKDMIIRDAAQKANELTDEEIYVTLAPPDMWGRTVDQGRSKADQFYEAGLTLTKSSNDREAGWMAIHDLLRFEKSEDGQISKPPRLHIFSTCRELIRCLPLLVHDDKKPTDAATEPHDITHICDALRYFAVYWSRPNEVKDTTPERVWTQDMFEDYWNATDEEKKFLIKRWGKPLGGF
jgi:hypothetical protein